MFIPISTDTSIRRTPWVNYALIAVNVAVFVLQSYQGRSGLSRILDLGVLEGGDPRLYQFFTYQFLHASWAHVGGNMLFLWVFGNPVNAKMGHVPYLLFYLAGGVFAATGYGLAHDHSMVGASGAIAAVTTAYLALFPRSHITVMYWWFLVGTFELPSMIMIVFKMILWDNMLAPRLVPEGATNVAFYAHLAGYAFGLSATAAMLLLRVLPRDQFDIVALWRRWFQRQAMRSAMSEPDAEARARFGRVARPVYVEDVRIGPARDLEQDRLTDLRMKIAEALGHNDRDTAADLYERMLGIDTRQVLARTQQLDVANQLYTLHRLPQAAAAYEKLLAHYPSSPEADQVKLLLGIIYARDLQQYEVAEAHLRQSLERFSDDERRRDQCRHWLDVVTRSLGRPTPDP